MNESPDNDESQDRSSADRSSFCDYLRGSRRAARLSLDDIARTTRIPQRSLEMLESGRFEELPADVFVRGFLRSYATCVGLDPGDALHRYAECGLTPAPVASPEASKIADADVKPRARAAHEAKSADACSEKPESLAREPAKKAVRPPAPILVIDDSDPERAEREQEKRADESRLTFLPQVLLDTKDGSRRGALTLAVIILVIVATITMSYLLRRPSSSGDGVTQLGPTDRATMVEVNAGSLGDTHLV